MVIKYAFPALLLALVSGCVVDGRLVPSGRELARNQPLPVSIVGDDVPEVVVDDALPDELTCVSAPLGSGGSFSDVIRVNAFRNESGGFTSSIQRGPQFWTHNGEWFGQNGEQLPAARDLELDVDADGALVGHDALGQFTIALQRDGLVLRGQLVDDQCYQHVEAALTCWSNNELFGSPWTGVVGRLPVRFDWTQGTCVKNGKPTDERNALPVELIRETSNGECAELEGVRLNGDDFAQPNLDGWFLPGAHLDGAEMFFADLNFATLDGADLSGFTFGYATVNGTFNDQTQLPEGMECDVNESPWAGQSVTCAQ